MMGCGLFKIFTWHPESSGSNTTSHEEVGRNHTDDTLEDIVKDFSYFLDVFPIFGEAKKEIEKMFCIKPKHKYNCWPEDDIKRAYKETKSMESSNRLQWASVIMLQVVKSFVCNTCKQNAAQKNRDATTVEHGFETTPNSEDRSSQSEDELQTVRAARRGEKNLGVGKTKYKVKKAKGKAKKKSSTKVSKVKKAKGKAKGKKCSKDRSAQRRPKPKTGGNSSAASESEETSEKHKTDTITYIRIPLTNLFGKKATSTPAKAEANMNSKYKLIDGHPEKREKGKDDKNKILRKKSYIMSFNNEKNNAEWVYEILNINTLSHYKTPQFKFDEKCTDSDYHQSTDRNSFTNKDYDRGHLAAAANHMWCQEAYVDTYYMENITPQNENLNRGRWKALENYCRDFVKDDKVRNVHVYTGPLYLNKEYKPVETTACVPEEGKAVPTHYFKVLIVEKNDGTVEEPEGFLIANKKEQTEEKKNIKYIEEISGLKFTETSEIPKLADVDHTRTATWKGNEGGKSVTIDVRISSFKKNDARPHSLN